MQRIIVIGCGGSGKSTFSLKLGEALSIPVVHLDQLRSTENQQKVNHKHFVAAQQQEIANPSWIIEGNYRSTLPMRIEAADTIIFLDFPTWLCLYGIGRRWLFWHLFRQQGVGSVNEKTARLDGKFLGWVWGFRRLVRQDVLALLANVIHRKSVIALRSRADLNRFLQDIAKTDSGLKAAHWRLNYRPKTD